MMRARQFTAAIFSVCQVTGSRFLKKNHEHFSVQNGNPLSFFWGNGYLLAEPGCYTGLAFNLIRKKITGQAVNGIFYPAAQSLYYSNFIIAKLKSQLFNPINYNKMKTNYRQLTLQAIKYVKEWIRRKMNKDDDDNQFNHPWAIF